MAGTKNDVGWESVPQLVEETYRRLYPLAKEARQKLRDAPYVWSSFDGRKIVGTANPDPPDASDDWVLIKSSTPLLLPIRKAVSALQWPLGGPSPLAAGIVGGLLGYGLGDVGGRVASLFSKDERRKQALRHSGHVLGVGAGVSLPALWGLINMANREQTGGGLSAWVSGWPFEKKGGIEGAGALTVPTIPVDAFNRAVWTDTLGANRFGTRSAFDGDQPMRTPAPVAATVSGLVSGASAALGGKKRVSAWDVARTAVASGAKGWLGGMLIGKTLGALAAVRPETQDKLKRIGLWGGLLTGAARSAFGP